MAQLREIAQETLGVAVVVSVGWPREVGFEWIAKCVWGARFARYFVLQQARTPAPQNNLSLISFPFLSLIFPLLLSRILLSLICDCQRQLRADLFLRFPAMCREFGSNPIDQIGEVE